MHADRTHGRADDHGHPGGHGGTCIQEFSIRAKVAECINGAAAAKVAISECRQTLGPWPSAGADAGPGGAAGDSRFCNGFVAYEAETGSFTIDVDEADIDGGIPGQISLRMTPGESPSNIINWNCTSGTTPVSNVKYLPATCRDA